MHDNLVWLKDSSKGRQIRRLLARVLEWKHSCSLSGANEFDFFRGCYGNPDANVVFVAEIPSLNAGRKYLKEHEHDIPENERWKIAWRATRYDIFFREALGRNRFIPEGKDDAPSTWNCWITNFVKCPEEDKRWKKKLKKKQTEKILKASSRYLIEELSIIEPKIIIIVGGRTLSHYKTYIESEIDAIDILIRHYSRINGERAKLAFERRIHKIRNLYDLIPS